MDIDKLAEITATEFDSVHAEIAGVKVEMAEKFDAVNGRLDHLEVGMRAVLEAVLEIPTKKVFEKLVHKVEDIDERVTSLERAAQPISPRG